MGLGQGDKGDECAGRLRVGLGCWLTRATVAGLSYGLHRRLGCEATLLLLLAVCVGAQPRNNSPPFWLPAACMCVCVLCVDAAVGTHVHRDGGKVWGELQEGRRVHQMGVGDPQRDAQGCMVVGYGWLRHIRTRAHTLCAVSHTCVCPAWPRRKRSWWSQDFPASTFRARACARALPER